jgi:hypothetical protein
MIYRRRHQGTRESLPPALDPAGIRPRPSLPARAQPKPAFRSAPRHMGLPDVTATVALIRRYRPGQFT